MVAFTGWAWELASACSYESGGLREESGGGGLWELGAACCGGKGCSGRVYGNGGERGGNARVGVGIAC